jgi:AcrR family transcriptional regulator
LRSANQDQPGGRAGRDDDDEEGFAMGRPLPIVSSAPGAAPATTQPGERKDAARNRKKILDAARKLLRTRGLDGVCMDELAAAAGVGKGTLYRRFTDKFALFRALLDDAEIALQERARARFDLPKDAPPALRLQTAWDAFVDFVVDHAHVLAAAEAEARRAALCDSAPYQWRRIELSRHLVACGVGAVRAELLADAWLQSLGADAVRRALERSPPDEVRSIWKSLPAGFAADNNRAS